MRSRCFSLWCALSTSLLQSSTLFRLDLTNDKIPQSAFIAGVQAQIVSLTIWLPVTPLSWAANLFGFVSLIFDINGTIAGVYDTLFIQGQTREPTAILSYNSDLQKQVNDIKKALEGISKEDSSKFEEQFNTFSEEMMKRYPSGKLRLILWTPFCFIAKHVLPTSTSNPWLLLLKPFKVLFLMPAQTMLFSIGALKLSIILLVGASIDLQRICCLIIFLSSMARLVLHGKHALV